MFSKKMPFGVLPHQGDHAWRASLNIAGVQVCGFAPPKKTLKQIIHVFFQKIHSHCFFLPKANFQKISNFSG